MAAKLPKFCWHKGRSLWYLTLNGREVYLSGDKQESRREYDRIVAEWLAAGRHLPSPADDLLVAELVDRYRVHVEGYYRNPVTGEPTSEPHSIRDACRTVRKLFGTTAAAEFTPLRFQALRQHWVSMGWSRKYINQQAGRVRRMFKWGTAQCIVPPSVYQGLIAVDGLKAGRCEARELPPVRPVDGDVVAATLPHLHPILADAVRVQALTGMRPGELLAMTPATIDRSGDVWTYRPASHKTQHHGHSRVVPLGPLAQAILAKYMLRAADAFLFSPRDVLADVRAGRTADRRTPRSCGNRPGSNRKRKPKRAPGERYSVQSFGRAIARAAKLAGVEHWHPHQLRHAHATRVRREYGLEAAQVALGHAQASVTQIYAERNLSLAVEVARKVG